MSISSLPFIYLFLPISILLYFIIRRFFNNLTNLYLVLISFLFYAEYNIKLAIIFFLIANLIYLYGVVQSKHKSKTLLIVFILAIIGLLSYFKYIDYLILVLNRFFHSEHDLLYLAMPLGLSFASFEAITYIVDIYKGEDKGDYLDVLLFLSFFPKICSGPIVSWHKFKNSRNLTNDSFDSLISGIERIIIGLAKKVIVADTLGKVINTIVSNYTSVDSFTSWLCALCYMLQLYIDFSGYSDMALGMSEIFGFKFEENFNYPYLSTSVSEFFRRWHISLGNFFKEYIYIPLGGNRKGNVYIHILVVYLVSGLWHGNGASYIVWGLIIGLAICLEKYINNKINTPKFIKWLFTFIFAYFFWILFMMPSFKDTVSYIVHMFSNIKSGVVFFTWRYYFDNKIIFTMLIGLLFSLYKFNLNESITNKKWFIIVKYMFLTLIFVISIIYMINSTYSPFLYFRF